MRKRLKCLCMIKKTTKRLTLLLSLFVVFSSFLTASPVHAETVDHATHIKRYILVTAAKNGCLLEKEIKGDGRPLDSVLGGLKSDQVVTGGGSGSNWPTGSVNVSRHVEPDDGKLWCGNDGSEGGVLQRALAALGKDLKQFVNDAYDVNYKADAASAKATATCSYTLNFSNQVSNYDMAVAKEDMYYKDSDQKWHNAEDNYSVKASGDKSGAASACEQLGAHNALTNTGLSGGYVTYSLKTSTIGDTYKSGSSGSEAKIFDKLTRKGFPSWFNAGNLDAADKYLYYRDMLTKVCGATIIYDQWDGSAGTAEMPKAVDAAGKLDTTSWARLESSSAWGRKEVMLKGSSGNFVWGGGEATCKDFRDKTSEYAQGYVAYLEQYPDEEAVGHPPAAVDDDPADETSTCNTGTALGWIICPVAEFLGGLIDDIYVWMEDTFLVIRPELLSDDESGTYGAWTRFRDMANIIFIMVLLVIVLSQVTGFGVSNYGIKKMLPKLVAVAILVNLSYIICQLAVDLSNIVGHQVMRLLTAIATQPDANGEATRTLATFTTGGPGGGGIVALVLGVGAIGALVAFGAIGGLLLALLGALISILVAFLILIVRQAAVVLLVAVAPVAFIFYILPNTEKIFQKWLGMFKGMLLIFPIAGAVMGGGKLAGIIIQSANTEDNVFTLIGVTCAILPFFALPSLIKGSMNALGSVGAKLAGLRAGAGLRAKGKTGMKAGAKKSIPGTALANTRRRIGVAMNKRVGRTFSRMPGALGTAATAKAGAALVEESEMHNKDVAAAQKVYELGAKGSSLDQMTEDLKNAKGAAEIQAIQNTMMKTFGPGAQSSIIEVAGYHSGADRKAFFDGINNNHKEAFSKKNQDFTLMAASYGKVKGDDGEMRDGRLEEFTKQMRGIGYSESDAAVWSGGQWDRLREADSDYAKGMAQTVLDSESPATKASLRGDTDKLAKIENAAGSRAVIAEETKEVAIQIRDTLVGSSSGSGSGSGLPPTNMTNSQANNQAKNRQNP